MTTTLLLVRHAAHALLGRVLTGRTTGISLSPEGRAQADRLATRLSDLPIAAVVTSPMERARETAQPIAARRNLEARVCEGLDEVDFGRWSGVAFSELEADPLWPHWNSSRGLARAPGGESMLEAQARAMEATLGLAEAHAGETIVLVSHCDVIRAIVCAALGLSLDLLHRFDVDPASVSRLLVGPWGARVTGLNEASP